MSESFNDLWVSSNPVKSQQSSLETLASVAGRSSNANGVTRRTTPDVFSILASAGSSQPSSRPITPASVRQHSKPDFNTSVDAFGDLVSFSGSTSRDDTLTIAERAAKAERERKAKSEKGGAALESQGLFWDQYETSTIKPVTAQPTQPLGAWDLYDVGSLETIGKPAQAVASRTNTPGSFDFGDREDDLFGSKSSQEENEDDILGSLAKPVEEYASSKPSHTIPSAPSNIPRVSTTSPPPHVLGKIVEMGFSVEQAKAALATTSTGLDVDAAIEFLLRDSRSSSPRHGGTSMALKIESGRSQGPSRATLLSDGLHSHTSSIHSDSSAAYQQGLQEQADKLLAQASTIGVSMFNKANAFWKEGREKVVKAYEEQRLGSMIADKGKGKDKGRPRWMDDSQKPPIPLEESVYKSPARRRPPALTSPPSAPLRIARTVVNASPSAQATSSANKLAGTEHFKLGRFSEAEVAYSRAIDALPASHLQRIPLHNNRALTRLKTGEYKGVIEDATEVIRLVTGDAGTAWHPDQEAKNAAKDLGDALSKALRRRGEAYEGLEKWKEATADWERLSATTWSSQTLKTEAMKGAVRCRRMVGGTVPPASSRPRLETEIKPTRVPSVAHSNEAVSRVRATHIAQEKEDQARHDLKDVVDTRLAAWRTGKETNLRALIASLDTVLSPTFRWQKVSMGELVSPGQVKVRYTKAIAKLHPDKLHVNNTTLEERMMANGIFATLNEAWNSFR